MPATITRTIKSSGGDYSSLSAWESAEQGVLTAAWGVAVSSVVGTYTAGETLNFTGSGATATFRTLVSGAMRFEVLTGTPAVSDVITGATSLATSTLDSITYSDGEIRQAECYGFGETASAFVVAGSTVDATRYRRIYAAAGAEAKMYWDTSTAYRFVASAGSNTASEAFLRIERVQIATSSTTSDRAALTLSGQSARAVGCVFADLGTADNVLLTVQPPAGQAAYAINCVLLGNGSTTLRGYQGAGAGAGATSYGYNLTVVGCITNYDTGARDKILKNCLSFDAGTTDYGTAGGAWTAGTAINASEDGTAPGTAPLLYVGADTPHRALVTVKVVRKRKRRVTA